MGLPQKFEKLVQVEKPEYSMLCPRMNDLRPNLPTSLRLPPLQKACTSAEAARAHQRRRMA